MTETVRGAKKCLPNCATATIAPTPMEQIPIATARRRRPGGRSRARMMKNEKQPALIHSEMRIVKGRDAPDPACRQLVRLTFVMAMTHSLSCDRDPLHGGTSFPPGSALLRPHGKAAVDFIEGQIPYGSNCTSVSRQK